MQNLDSATKCVLWHNRLSKDLILGWPGLMKSASYIEYCQKGGVKCISSSISAFSSRNNGKRYLPTTWCDKCQTSDLPACGLQSNTGMTEGEPLNLSVSCSCQKCGLDFGAPRNGTGGPSQGDLQHALINWKIRSEFLWNYYCDRREEALILRIWRWLKARRHGFEKSHSGVQALILRFRKRPSCKMFSVLTNYLQNPKLPVLLPSIIATACFYVMRFLEVVEASHLRVSRSCLPKFSSKQNQHFKLLRRW